MRGSPRQPNRPKCGRHGVLPRPLTGDKRRRADATTFDEAGSEYVHVGRVGRSYHLAGHQCEHGNFISAWLWRTFFEPVDPLVASAGASRRRSKPRRPQHALGKINLAVLPARVRVDLNLADAHSCQREWKSQHSTARKLARQESRNVVLIACKKAGSAGAVKPAEAQ